MKQNGIYYLPGTLIGAFLGGWIGDKVGRTRTIAFASIWSIIGATLQCSSQNSDWTLCGESKGSGLVELSSTAK